MKLPANVTTSTSQGFDQYAAVVPPCPGLLALLACERFVRAGEPMGVQHAELYRKLSEPALAVAIARADSVSFVYTMVGTLFNLAIESRRSDNELIGMVELRLHANGELMSYGCNYLGLST